MKNIQKSPSFRTQKIASRLTQILGPVIKEQLENRPDFVTITNVEISRDLKWAKVFISIIGQDDEAVLSELRKNIYTIQGEVNSQLHMKIFPRIDFVLDLNARHAAKISGIIKKLHEE